MRFIVTITLVKVSYYPCIAIQQKMFYCTHKIQIISLEIIGLVRSHTVSRIVKSVNHITTN